MKVLKLMMTIVLGLFGSTGLAQITQNKKDMDSQLKYLIKEPISDTKHSPLLVLLHGHGSNESDLFGLADKMPNRWTVASVRGPFMVGPNSFRWYDVGMVNGKIEINIEQEELSRKMLIELISEIVEKHNIDRNKIVVAGFSQGANMAQSLGLGEPQIAAGFGVFSGRYVAEFIPYISNSKNLQNTKAFLSHGSSDHMLPKTYADENISKLKELGLKVSYIEDTNGHSISPRQWGSFVEWIQKL